MRIFLPPSPSPFILHSSRAVNRKHINRSMAPRGRRDRTVPSSPDLHKYSAETSTESPAGISRLPSLPWWFQIQTRPVASARRPSHWVMDGLSLPPPLSPLSTHIESKATESRRIVNPKPNSTCFFFRCSRRLSIAHCFWNVNHGREARGGRGRRLVQNFRGDEI